jgi:magnesium-transporting ATPase (P-type)
MTRQYDRCSNRPPTCRQSVDEVLFELRTDAERGLTEADCGTRREQYGPNQLIAEKPVPAGWKFVGQFADTLVLLLLAAIAISTALWFYERETALPYDAIAIAAVVLLNAMIGYLQEARTELAVAALQHMTATRAQVIRWRRSASRLMQRTLEQHLVFAGLIGMIYSPRDEAKDAVARARGAGIRVMMITGDHPKTAGVIARELGIVSDSRIVTRTELGNMSDAVLAQVGNEVSVYARVNTEHKLCIVKALQTGGATVAMTGDGVNDAPALKTADIGVAMGITGTEVSKTGRGTWFSPTIISQPSWRRSKKAIRCSRTFASSCDTSSRRIWAK